MRIGAGCVRGVLAIEQGPMTATTPDSNARVLISQAELLGPVLALVDKGVLLQPTPLKTIGSMAGIASAKLPTLATALRLGAVAGALKESAGGDWHVACSKDDARQLACMLRGVIVYRQHVHKDDDKVSVVISKPAEPSQFVVALDKTLEGFWGIETTSHALIGLAQRARARFTVMTPFVDDAGMARVLALFETTRPAVRRELIVRRPLPAALTARAAELERLGVHVFDFRISRDASGEHETFHAKVVRVDDNECYVGSSNMNQWSFDYSLELGFHVCGQAGHRVSLVLDAVLAVSSEVHLSS